MKRIRYFSIIILLLPAFVVSEVKVWAMNTGFSTESLSEEDMTTLLRNTYFSVLADEPPKQSIECFDVNEDGLIAIGSSNGETKTVCIYTSDGAFQYGYSFKSNGTFGIEFDKNLLNIYFVRSDVILSLDSDGNVLEIRLVQDTTDNNTYRNSLLHSTTRTVGNTTYLVRNDMGILNWVAMSFSQVVTIDATGTETIVYDVNSTQLLKMIAAVVGVIIFVSIVVTTLIRTYTKPVYKA